MRTKSSKISKLIAGAAALMLTMSGAADTCFASGISEEKVMTEKTGSSLAGSEDISHIHPVDINASTFPDPNFRAVIASRDYDRDGDGHLDVDEIILARNLWCIGQGIKSLQGIEYLVELRGLYCMDNEIETMDISNNKLLTGVWCSGNKFTTLDFTPNPDLEWVYCFDCNLTSLNVANNPKMSYIECNTNPLKELDVTHNPLLEHLMCGSCELTTLDLSQNPNLQHLDAFRNRFTTLDLSHNPKMKRLDIWDNPGLGSIDISNNPGLQYYNCAHNEVTSIDVSHNPELNKLICSYNPTLTELDISHNPKLVYLDCACDGISSLDISKNPNLRFLQAFTNPFTELNIGNNPFLVKTYNEGVKQAEYQVCKGHSWTIDYGGDTSTGGDNIYFLCFDDIVTLSTESNGAAPVFDYHDNDDGITDTTDLVTREALVQTLYEMAGRPGGGVEKSRFTDVVPGAWYEDALRWGEANSICVGYPYVAADTFGIGKWVTRQDAALMLMRYSEFANYKRAIDFGRSDEYLDYYDIDFDHWEAICWTSTWNLMDGKGEPGAPKSEQNIDPYGKATRAEIEEMINRLYEVNGVAAKASVYTPPASPVVPPATVTDPAPGDVNRDGQVNSLDATAVLVYYALISTKQDGGFDEEQKKLADYNRDGAVNSSDASDILAYYADLSTAGN